MNNIESGNEKKELLKYCQDIINIAPETSVEYKIAKLAFIQLNQEHDEIVEMCKHIKENSDENSPQNKIVSLVLNQFNQEKSNIAIPDGWKLAPLKPFPEMFMFIPAMVKMTINHDEYDVSRLNERNALWIYQQMLNRIPQK